MIPGRLPVHGGHGGHQSLCLRGRQHGGGTWRQRFHVRSHPELCMAFIATILNQNFCYSPHHCVWGSCFSLASRRAAAASASASASARRRVPHSPHSSHLTHHSTTHHTTCQSHHAVTSQYYSSHHLSCRVAGAVHRVWQAHYTEPGGAAARVVAG